MQEHFRSSEIQEQFHPFQEEVHQEWGHTNVEEKRERLVYFQCSFSEDGAVEADLGGLGIAEQRRHPLPPLEHQLLHG